MNFELTIEFIDELKEALKASDERKMIELVGDLHAADIAEVLDEIDIEDAQRLCQILPGDKASDVLIELEEDVREKFLEILSPKDIAHQYIEHLDSDDAADIIAELPEEKRELVIDNIDDAGQASDIVDLLNYQEGTAGALMGKELIWVSENWSVMRSVKEMRRQAADMDQVYSVYVVDENHKLLGLLPLKKLLLANTKATISNLYNPNVRRVKTYTEDDEVATIMEKYDLVALPVVDELNRLVGRITIDDVVDVIKEEAEKDYQLASGISSDVDQSDNVWQLTRARLPWLIIGMIGGMAAAAVIGVYEESIALIPAMAFFIPLITAMAGNIGVQSSAIIVQGLANNSLELGGILNKLRKEFVVAALNGFVLSILAFIASYLFYGDYHLGGSVAMALFTVIIVAALLGTLVPLVLDKYGIDPALATGPFITTLNDIIGLFIYFMIGQLVYSYL
jgi:magnesium transporter